MTDDVLQSLVYLEMVGSNGLTLEKVAAVFQIHAHILIVIRFIVFVLNNQYQFLPRVPQKEHSHQPGVVAS
jgi:hypothetical protein